MADLIKVTIDGREALVPKGTLIVEAAKQVGVEIPVFCYHEKMHPVGACRMCLVEIEKVPRPQAACTTPVGDGMVVKTDSPMAVQARQGVIEFVLCNHPLDCPVCDKGGECPLQDAVFKFGGDKSRYAEGKRHHAKPIRFGPEIVLDRERCVLCTRCVRFHREIVGDENLTVLQRGSRSFIGVLPGRSFDSPFSGNTIELCPVGALTSARFRFQARSWELKETPSVCSLCSVGCNVKIESRDGRVARLTSRENAEVDDGWLCDRGRFTYEFVGSAERLKTPLVRKNGELAAATWSEALEVVARGLKDARGQGVGGLISAGSTNEELYLFQKLFRVLLRSNSVDHGARGDYSPPEVSPDAASGTIAGLESAAVILAVGIDPLAQQPVLDLRLKKAVWRKRARLISISSRETDLTELARPRIAVRDGAEAAVVNGIVLALLSGGLSEEVARERLGGRYEQVVGDVGPFTPEKVLDSAGVQPDLLAEVARLLAGTTRIALLFPRPEPGDPAGLQEACARLSLLTGSLLETAGGLYPLGTESNSQGALDMGVSPWLLPGQRPLLPAHLDSLERTWQVRPADTAGLSGGRMLQAAAGGRLKGMYLAGFDPIGAEGGDRAREALSRVGFLVVQDTFLTAAASLAHVVLPAASFAEQEGTFTNLERRVQRLQSAVASPGQARPGWRILADVGAAMGADWRYQVAAEVFEEIVEAAPLYRGLRFESLGAGGRRWRYPGAADETAPGNGHARRLWFQPLEKPSAESPSDTPAPTS